MAAAAVKQTRQVKHGQHNLDWPKTEGIFTAVDYDHVLGCIKRNERWNITEKYDGCTIHVSSSKWVRSRTINLFNRNELDWKSEKIQNVGVTHLEPVFEQSDGLHQLFIQLLGQDGAPVETDIVGEFILKGTGSCKHDLYDYASKSIKVGRLYAFGVTLTFSTRADQQLKLQKLGFNTGFSSGNGKYHVPINKVLQKMMESLKIRLIPVIKYDRFNSLLTNPVFLEPLINRTIEGFMLSKGQKILKWKYPVKKNEDSVGYLNNLRLDLLDVTKSLSQPPDVVMDCLEALLNNVDNFVNEDTIEDAFDRMYQSAKSKHPEMESRFTRASIYSGEELENEIENYVDSFYQKIRKDLKEEIGLKELDKKQICELTDNIRSRLKKVAQKDIRFAKKFKTVYDSAMTRIPEIDQRIAKALSYDAIVDEIKLCSDSLIEDVKKRIQVMTVEQQKEMIYKIRTKINEIAVPYLLVFQDNWDE